MSNVDLSIDWSEVNLGSLGIFFRGRGGTKSDELYNGLPCIRYGDLYTHHDCIVNTFCSAINPSNAYLYSPLQTGDIVFAASGETFEEIGKAAAYCGDEKAYAGADTIIFRPSCNLDSYFAGYTVNSNYAVKHKSRLGQGSSVIHISADHLSSIPIKLPPIQQQKKIAMVFQTIDRTIAKTEALIEKYQQIKAGLMHDLFTRGIGADGKLRSPREEVPELYQESAIGWIPKEWKFKPLDYGLSDSPKNGFSPKEVETWQGIYVLGLSCLTKNGFSPLHLKKAPQNALLSGAKLEDGDFLISRSNTQSLVGLCGIYRDVGYNAIYPDLMMKLKFNRNLIGRFLEKYLLSEAARQKISAIAVGTSSSMVKINATTLKSLKIVYPETDEQIKIVEKLEPIEKHINCLRVQFNKLQKQKSGLMYDLLTGKVSVNVDSDAP